MEQIRDRLYRVALMVRQALELPSISHESFPRASCQLASRVLGKYLVAVEGLTPIEGVANGVRFLASDDPEGPIEQSHFWLEHAGHVIDITADQFEDVSESVIVTRDRRWHRQFGGQTRVAQEELIRLNFYLEPIYQKVLRHVEGQR